MGDTVSLYEKTELAHFTTPERLAQELVEFCKQGHIEEMIVIMRGPNEFGGKAIEARFAGVRSDQIIALLTKALHYSINGWPEDE